jgi:hypothetical protein
MACITSRNQDLERRRVDFSGAKIKLVVLKPGQEVPGAAVTAPPPPPNSINAVLGKRCVPLLDTSEGQVVAENVRGRAVLVFRRSTRGRQRGGGDNHVIEGVDSSDTVSVFKLKAWQVIQFEEGQNITLYHEVSGPFLTTPPQATIARRLLDTASSPPSPSLCVGVAGPGAE